MTNIKGEDGLPQIRLDPLALFCSMLVCPALLVPAVSVCTAEQHPASADDGVEGKTREKNNKIRKNITRTGERLGPPGRCSRLFFLDPKFLVLVADPSVSRYPNQSRKHTNQMIRLSVESFLVFLMPCGGGHDPLLPELRAISYNDQSRKAEMLNDEYRSRGWFF